MTRRSFAQMIWLRIANPVLVRLSATVPERRAACHTYVAREQRPRCRPVGPLVVSDLAGPTRVAQPAIDPPGGAVFDPVGRVGDHQLRLLSSQHRLDGRLVGAVAADEPVGAHAPDVTCDAHRPLGDVRDLVLVGEAAGDTWREGGGRPCGVTPRTERSAPSADKSVSSSLSIAMSQPALRAIRLSASTSCRRCTSDSPRSGMTGTSARPSCLAAASRPWPAITSPFSLTRIGLLKPNARMLPAISAICASLWVRALRGEGIRRSSGQNSSRRRPALASPNIADV